MKKIIWGNLPLFLIIIVLIIAAFLRVYNITQLPPGLYPDEAMNGSNALEALSTGNFKIFYPENNGREGLFINIQAMSVAIFGNEPWALRIVSALFGTFTVLGVYFLAKELFRRKEDEVSNSGFKITSFEIIALLAALFIATNFWHINFSRIGFRAIMAPFFLVWAIYFLLLAIRKYEVKKKLALFFSGAGGVFFGLGFYSYIAYRVAPLLLLLLIPFYWKSKNFWKVAAVFIITTFLTAAPIGWYFLKHTSDFLGRTSQVSVFSSHTAVQDLSLNVLKTTAMFNFVGDGNWRHNYAGAPELFWPIGILFLIGVFIGLRSLIKNEYRLAYTIIFGWLAFVSLPVVISNEGIPHALRAIIMIPPVMILAGVGGYWAIQKIRSLTSTQWQSAITGFIFALCALLVAYSYYFYFFSWGKNPNVQGAFAQNYVDLGRQLNSLPKDLPKYVLIKAGGADVRGIPMPTQTVMFITDTFTPEKQKAKNIFYILPDKEKTIPPGSYKVVIE